ncbi:hypothetical protein M3Y94_00395300 [Aphelenchoides besseyi]|nr:hypothetical protein M3Y94_00395300 [Aphelenchoides besseyi]KAI6234962.1 hypothetical protein M3Y95_00001400 [Aphelenchoides besseyi]
MTRRSRSFTFRLIVYGKMTIVFVEYFDLETMIITRHCFDNVNSSHKVADLKAAFRAKYDVPDEDLVLFFVKMELEDDRPLWSYGMFMGTTFLNLYRKSQMEMIVEMKKNWLQEYHDIRSLQEQLRLQPTNLELRAKLERQTSHLKDLLGITSVNSNREIQQESTPQPGLRRRNH